MMMLSSVSGFAFKRRASRLAALQSSMRMSMSKSMSKSMSSSITTRSVPVSVPVSFCRFIGTTTWNTRSHNRTAEYTRNTTRNTTRNFATEAPQDLYELKIPDMGDSITEGDVAEILKGVGSGVVQDEVLAVIETDKVNVDIRSPVTGSVEKINFEQGDTIEVGDTLMQIRLGEGQEQPAQDSQESKPPSDKAPADKPPAEAAPAAPAAAAAATEEADSHEHPSYRTPLIHFRHGDRASIDLVLGLESAAADALESAAAPDAAADSSVAAAPKASAEDILPYTGIPAKYRKKSLSEHAMQLIEMGGAEPY